LTSLQKPGSWLYLAPSELSELTTADDVVLPWSSPATAKIQSESWVLVGLSLPKRTWLREYFQQPELAFDYEASPHLVRQANLRAKIEPHAATQNFSTWPLNKTQSVALKVDNTVPPLKDAAAAAHTERHIAVVPATMTSWLAAHAAGTVDFDAAVQLFVPLPQPPVYDRARLYARTIDNVPEVVQALSQKQFAVMSETGRISEIQRQDVSLQLLVLVVGAGVFLFGVITVVSVLIDSTDRKRGTIGILRVMGMSRGGIFISILMRAAAIGFFAAAASVACGWGLAKGMEWVPPTHIWWLHWKPIMNVDLYPADWTIVAAGSLLCCCFGALLPAWRASRLDPFDAIVEGRFR
ncbi:MAG: FtsX-like permease family protein, partial [Planctomycetota bacterium]